MVRHEFLLDAQPHQVNIRRNTAKQYQGIKPGWYLHVCNNSFAKFDAAVYSIAYMRGN